MASFWVSILIFGAGHGKNGWKWIEIILVKFRDSRQSSWRFQPSWKNTSQIRSFFQGRGIFIPHIWVATKPRNLLFWSNKTWPVGQLVHRINLFFKKRGQLFQVLRTPAASHLHVSQLVSYRSVWRQGPYPFWFEPEDTALFLLTEYLALISSNVFSCKLLSSPPKELAWQWKITIFL